MSEREMRRFLQNMEGEDQDPAEFDVEMEAWNHAVFISDYMQMFRSGSSMAVTIYGDPYDSRTRPFNGCEYSDYLAALHKLLTDNGLETVNIDKPDPKVLFPGPATRNADPSQPFWGPSNQDHMRLQYQQKFLEMMYGWGYRDITEIGIAGYLSKVPDQLSLLTFCAPDGTKSFVSQDGYVASGYALEPDYERPISQRGGHSGFLEPGYGHLFEGITSQLGFLVDHLDRFEFKADDLLGYRPKEMTEAGISAAWDGWDSAA